MKVFIEHVKHEFRKLQNKTAVKLDRNAWHCNSVLLFMSHSQHLYKILRALRKHAFSEM